MNNIIKNKEILYLIIYIIIASLGWLIQPIEPITIEGMKLLSIFLATIVAWGLTNELWPCLLTLVLLPFTELITFNEMLISGWGCDITLFIIMLFILIALLNETGAMNMLVGRLLTIKFLQNHPWRIIFMIFLITIIITSFCNAFTGILLAWGIVYKICEKLNYKPFDKFPTLMIFGIAVMGAIGLATLPWSISVLTISNAYFMLSGQAINFIEYLIYSIPLGIISILSYLFLCKFIFKLDVKKLSQVNLDFFQEEELKFNKERKVAIGALISLISLILIQSLFPQTTIGIILAKLGMSLKIILILLLFSFFKKENGDKIINFSELAKNGISWSIVLMVFVINIFINYISLSSVGFNAFLIQTFSPLLNNTSIFILLILICLITIILTNFMNNIVIATIMISTIIPLISLLPVEQLQIIFLIISSCFIAFLLPAASAPSMCLFSNIEWIKTKDIYKYGIPTVIILFIVTFGWNYLFFLL